MKKALIGKKIGMTQYVKNDGSVVAATICELGPCVVVQKKTEEKDGYPALKLGYLDVREKLLAKPIADDLKKKNLPLKRVFGEVGVFDNALDVGSVVSCSIFSENDHVSVTGVSKGKGFQGVVKRYGFGGGRITHGSCFHRAPGSIGAHTYPAEVWRGKKMPGRHGTNLTTIKNLTILKIFQDTNIVLISGPIPGRRNSIITVSEI